MTSPSAMYKGKEEELTGSLSRICHSIKTLSHQDCSKVRFWYTDQVLIFEELEEITTMLELQINQEEQVSYIDVLSSPCSISLEAQEQSTVDKNWYKLVWYKQTSIPPALLSQGIQTLLDSRVQNQVWVPWFPTRKET